MVGRLLRPLVALGAVAGLLLAVLALQTPNALSAAVGPNSGGFFGFNQAGHGTYTGFNRSFPNVTVTGTGPYVATMTNGGDEVSFTFDTSGGALAVGQYNFNGTNGVLDLVVKDQAVAASKTCGVVDGFFVVDAVTFTGGGAIESLAMHFDVWCDRAVATTPSANGGDIWFNMANGPISAVDATEFVAVSPLRIADTRELANPLTAAETRTFQVTGNANVPSSATAVALNVTGISLTSSGFITLSPTGPEARPLVSNLNLQPGAISPNFVIVRLGSGGAVDVFLSSGSSHILLDVAGYFEPSANGGGSRLRTVTPKRILDTRTPSGGGTLSATESRLLDVDGATGSPVPAGATAVVLDVVAVNATAPTYITVHPNDVGRPVVSNLNVASSAPVPNLVIVQLPADGVLRLYNHNGTVDLAVDVMGYFTADTSGSAGQFVPLKPERLVDTRQAQWGPALGAGQVRFWGIKGYVRRTDATAVPGLYPFEIIAAALNTTAVDPTKASYLSVYPAASSPSGTSNLNFGAGETRPNMVISGLSDEGSVAAYNNEGSTHVIFDLAGYFTG